MIMDYVTVAGSDSSPPTLSTCGVQLASWSSKILKKKIVSSYQRTENVFEGLQYLQKHWIIIKLVFPSEFMDLLPINVGHIHYTKWCLSLLCNVMSLSFWCKNTGFVNELLTCQMNRYKEYEPQCWWSNAFIMQDLKQENNHRGS